MVSCAADSICIWDLWDLEDCWAAAVVGLLPLHHRRRCCCWAAAAASATAQCCPPYTCLASIGIATNIVSYLTKQLNLSNSSAASAVNIWSGVCCESAVVGACWQRCALPPLCSRVVCAAAASSVGCLISHGCEYVVF